MGPAVMGLEGEGFSAWEVPGVSREKGAGLTLGVTPSVAKPQLLLVRRNLQLPLGGDCED